MANMGNDNNGRTIQAAYLPVSGKTIQLIANTPSAPVAGGLYRFHAAQDTHLAVGTVVTTGDLLLQAGVDEYFMLNKGDTVIADAAVSMTEMP